MSFTENQFESEQFLRPKDFSLYEGTAANISHLAKLSRDLKKLQDSVAVAFGQITSFTLAELKELFPHLMAELTDIDGSVAEVKTLAFVDGANLITHSPFFAILVYKSGTMTGLKMTLKAETLDLTGELATDTTGFGEVNKKNLFVFKGDRAIPSDDSTLLKLDVTDASLTACTFDIYVFGVEI